MSTGCLAPARAAPRWGVPLLLGLASVLSLSCRRPEEATVQAPAGVKVAAASDLTAAFEELGREYERLQGEKVTFIFGASGMLARQLARGAPYDAFYSANEAFADEAVKSGACDGSTKRVYARGHLVLWTRHTVAPPGGLADLADARFAKIAIAHPEYAPYGGAAREALRRSGLWDTLQPRIVFGENVKHTLQLARSGNADAALVPLSQALSARDGQHLSVEGSLHAPIEQTSVICLRGTSVAGARKFAEFVHSAAGRGLLARHGFSIPGP